MKPNTSFGPATKRMVEMESLQAIAKLLEIRSRCCRVPHRPMAFIALLEKFVKGQRRIGRLDHNIGL